MGAVAVIVVGLGLVFCLYRYINLRYGPKAIENGKAGQAKTAP